MSHEYQYPILCSQTCIGPLPAEETVRQLLQSDGHGFQFEVASKLVKLVLIQGPVLSVTEQPKRTWRTQPICFQPGIAR